MEAGNVDGEGGGIYVEAGNILEIFIFNCAVYLNVNALVLNCFPICDDKFILTYPFFLLMQVHVPNASEFGVEKGLFSPFKETRWHLP